MESQTLYGLIVGKIYRIVVENLSKKVVFLKLDQDGKFQEQEPRVTGESVSVCEPVDPGYVFKARGSMPWVRLWVGGPTKAYGSSLAPGSVLTYHQGKIVKIEEVAFGSCRECKIQ